MAKKTNFIIEVNKYIGTKIYELRLSNGLSRITLASQINVTAQQLQKYEKGTNLISIGRLMLIAKAFNKDIGYFYTNFSENVNQNSNTVNNSCLKISQYFSKIKNPEQQDAIRFLLKTLATNTIIGNENGINTSR